MYDYEKIIYYLQKRIDHLLEATSEAAIEISVKRENGVNSTFHILNKALSQDKKYREEFKIKDFIK